jgi:MFS family permease
MARKKVCANDHQICSRPSTTGVSGEWPWPPRVPSAVCGLHRNISRSCAAPSSPQPLSRGLFKGLGVGGEWGGSVLMSMEWARSNQSCGLVASWPQFGVPRGLFLANLAVLAFSQISGEHFLAWGWRVPLVLSLFLVAVGLFISSLEFSRRPSSLDF